MNILLQKRQDFDKEIINDDANIEIITNKHNELQQMQNNNVENDFLDDHPENKNMNGIFKRDYNTYIKNLETCNENINYQLEPIYEIKFEGITFNITTTSMIDTHIPELTCKDVSLSNAIKSNTQVEFIDKEYINFNSNFIFRIKYGMTGS